MKYQPVSQSTSEKVQFSTNAFPVNPVSEEISQYGHFNQPARGSPKSTLVQRLFALRGWRLSVFLGLITTFVIMVINIALLAWIYSTLEVTNGSAIAYRGNKSEMKRISTWSHLAINILSSLLLAASNNAMQCLVAPTRRETEKAHAQGKWMQIGIPGMHNLSKIGRSRVLLWILFFCSSLPIHLLYNSVIYDTLGSNDYIIAYVAPEFITGGPWYPQYYLEERNAQMDTFRQYQQTPNSLVRLEKADCVRAYGTPYVQNWTDVIVVMDRSNINDTVYAMQPNVLRWSGSPFPNWLCGIHDYKTPCTLQVALEQADHWQFKVYPNSTDVPFLSHELANVQYCLVQPATAESYVEISPNILIGVIICNIVKVMCFITTLSYALGNHDPLITTGDAVQSFLAIPDATTIGNSILTAQDVKSGRWTSKKASSVWQPKRRFWFSAASVKRWIWLGLLVSIFWACGIVLLIMGIHNLDSGDYTKGLASIPFSYLVSLGFGEPTPATTIVQSSIGNSIVQFKSITQNIIVSNLPQLALSMSYFLYNGTWTAVLTMHEWTTYALSSTSNSKAKGLRVSNPQGAQRSTTYLQLPYLYSVPLLITAALLHWFVSRSLFITRINSRGLTRYNINEDPDQTIDALGWSPVPLICTLVLAFAMMLVLWLNGLRRYSSKIPLAATNSLSIAAACHRRREDSEFVAQQKLVFGDVFVSGNVDGDGDDTGHATFTADLNCVAALVEGRSYR